MPKNNKLNICFFASHGGSNMQAIIDNIKLEELDIKISLVISNNSNSTALERAINEGIPSYHLSSITNPDNLDDVIIDKIKEYKVNIILLAGYMRKLGDRVIDEVEGRVLNIHPALLPKFGGKGMYGMNVHQAVIDAKEKKSGATVHIVSSNYDEGRILNQIEVDVFPEDDPETLAKRVLEVEHFIYTDTLKKILSGEIRI